MSWDEFDPRPKPVPAAVLGEDLSNQSLADLNARIAALTAEIDRVRQEIDKRHKQSNAADALFRKS